MNRDSEYSLLLLAGGKSSRMGRDKAELLFEGKTFQQQLLDKADQAGIRKKYLSGHEGTGKDAELQTVKDRYRERGPLGGLHAGLLAAETPFCMVLPVDVPQLPAELLCRLLDAHEGLPQEERRKPFLVKHKERTEPLIGVYPKEMADFIEKQIKEQGAPVFCVLEQWGYGCFETALPAWQLENINTPQAYEELLRHQERGRDK